MLLVVLQEKKRTVIHWLARTHDKYANFVGGLLAADRSLGAQLDADQRTPLAVAKRECKEAIQRALFFLVRAACCSAMSEKSLCCSVGWPSASLTAFGVLPLLPSKQGRYELLSPSEPKHRSATCVVHFAKDVRLQPPADVVLKFMRNEDQFLREVRTRGGTLEPPADGGDGQSADTARVDGAGGSSSDLVSAAGPAGQPAPPAAAEPSGASSSAAAAEARKQQQGPAAAGGGGRASALPATPQTRVSALLSSKGQRLSPDFVLPVLRTHAVREGDPARVGQTFEGCGYAFVLVMQARGRGAIRTLFTGSMVLLFKAGFGSFTFVANEPRTPLYNRCHPLSCPVAPRATAR